MEDSCSAWDPLQPPAPFLNSRSPQCNIAEENKNPNRIAVLTAVPHANCRHESSFLFSAGVASLGQPRPVLGTVFQERGGWIGKTP